MVGNRPSESLKKTPTVWGPWRDNKLWDVPRSATGDEVRMPIVKSKSAPETDEASMSPEMTLHSWWTKSTSKWMHRTRKTDR